MGDEEGKILHLHEVIKSYRGNIAVAFSGGVDSSFLLSAAREILRSNLIAITVKSRFVPQGEIDETAEIAAELAVPHEIIEVDFKEIQNFVNNPEDRCYYCKRHMFKRIMRFAKERGFETVMEASNTDDLDDYRPGFKALKELGVKSPLIEAEFAKEEIRRLSKERGLSNWSKPANSCLATRIETGQEITEEKLKQVEEAEKYLKSLGIGLCRVRHHGAYARIEVMSDQLEILLDPETRAGIEKRFSELGFIYVAVDMEGYKKGNMNKL